MMHFDEYRIKKDPMTVLTILSWDSFCLRGSSLHMVHAHERRFARRMRASQGISRYGTPAMRNRLRRWLGLHGKFLPKLSTYYAAPPCIWCMRMKGASRGARVLRKGSPAYAGPPCEKLFNHSYSSYVAFVI